jgi:hypothetical protein
MLGLVILLLVGCSSHANTSDRSGYGSLSALCNAMGSPFDEEPYAHADFTADEGYCGDVPVAWFATSALRDKWLAAATGFGGVYVVGDRWAVTLDSPAAARGVQARVGGTVKDQ